MRALIVVAILSICIPSLVRAEAIDAKEHYRRGTNAFNLGHYMDAVKEYEAAYQLKEDPALLFNIAQAYRLAGENESAVRVYKSFVHQSPDSPLRSEVEKRIVELQTIIEQQHKTKEAPPEGTLSPKSRPSNENARASVTPVTLPAKPTDVRAPWYRDGAAMALGTVGVAALGAGIGLTIKGNLDLSHAQSATDLQQHDDLRSSGTTLSIAGYATLGVGVALCAAAIIRWAVRPKRQRVAVGVGGSRGGASLTFAGSY